MVRLTKLTIACVAIILSIPGVTFGSIIEVGDLNIIQQAGNASDGLRFLDMTYSVGKNKADALANAQATYSNARLATASEWDDLFQASEIAYDGILTASAAFEIHPNDDVMISTGANYGDGTLQSQLGGTASWEDKATYIWSDPDGNTSLSSTMDALVLYTPQNKVWIEQHGNPGNSQDFGWLIVSAVPEPSSIAMWSALGIIGLVVARRKRKLTRAA